MLSAGAAIDWWDALPSLVRQAADPLPCPHGASWFRLGDALLALTADYDPLVEELEAVYGDCRIGAPVDGSTVVRCTARLLRGTRLLALSFDGADIGHPTEIALVPYRFRRQQRYTETASPMAGWRVIITAHGRMLIAGDSLTALINLEEAPPEFVVECIVGVVRSAQSGVLFLHAASVGVAGSGALLIAPSLGGKSTTALALALRGHAFLGDDVAAVRLATKELLPFPRSAGLREGPLANLLDERLRSCTHSRISGRHGIPRTVVRAADLFPGSTSGPLPLRFAFVLEGFAESASATPLVASFKELSRLRTMVVMETLSSWGVSPGRDLMQLLRVIGVLMDLRCYSVKLGSIENTSGLIESVMRS